jgi:hypothetical protein
MPAPAGKPRVREKNLAERAVVEWNRQRTETQRHLSEKYRLENEITRSEVLRKSELVKGLAMVADAIRARILSSDLSRSAKEDILREISIIPLVLEEVSRGQTRLPRGNGTRPESKGEEG